MFAYFPSLPQFKSDVKIASNERPQWGIYIFIIYNNQSNFYIQFEATLD